MSTTTVSGNTDVPLATVNTAGLSEILGVLALIASLCTALLGHDFGITKNAQAIAQAAVIIIPVALSFSRAIKHHGIAHANAIVLAAQLGQGVYDISTARHAAAPLAPFPAAAEPVADPPTDVTLPQPPDVGADLPIETVSTVLPA